MKTIQFIVLFLSTVLFVSCGEESLQKYFVKKQEDPKFLKMDLSPSLLEGKNINMSEESQEALKSIKKINIVAYPLKDENREDFKWELEEIESILSQEKYKELTRIKNPGWNLNVSYTGNETTIDEVIVYGLNKTRGFVVFRLLGNDLKPEQIIPIIHALGEGDFNLGEISGLEGIFGPK